MNKASDPPSQATNLEFNPKLALKRKERDIAKLLMSDYKILQNKPGAKFHELILQFDGPKNTPYEQGSWEIYVLIPDQYPYKSPSIGFINKIFHPNIDFDSGSVCLDVINQTWSPMYELINVFDAFLPQLLTYPNPKDPLNPEAAMLFIKDEGVFNEVVSDFCVKYAPKKPVLLKTNSSITSTSGQSNNSNLSIIQLANPEILQRAQSQSVSASSSSGSIQNRERKLSTQVRGTSTSIQNSQQSKNTLQIIESENQCEIKMKEESGSSTMIQEQDYRSQTKIENEEVKDNSEDEDSYNQSEQYLSEISQTNCSELSQTEIDNECAQEY